jgi:hypothetical protein
MKRNKLWSILLLISLSFSIFHGLAFANFDHEEHDVYTFIHEISEPSDHNDMCDFHAEFHNSYLLPQKKLLYSARLASNAIQTSPMHVAFDTTLNLLKPPIL